MPLLDRAVALSLPLVPRAAVERVSARYIAGTTIGDALTAVGRLAAEGSCATVDLLGEEVEDDLQAEATVAAYREAIAAIHAAGAPTGISIKLSALGLRASVAAAQRRTAEVVEAAATAKRFVRIDMEDSSTVDDTLAVYRALRGEGLVNVGVVLQARLRRSQADARELLRDGIADVRICKGIYLEPTAIAWREPETIRRSWAALAEELIAGGGRVAFATHDEPLVFQARRLAERHDPDGERHEYQMLLGVRDELRHAVSRWDGRMRVYVPYGADAHAYSVRRLRENPAIGGHVARALVASGRARVGI